MTDLAFLPDSLKGRNIRGNNETAMLSVAVDSRCQVHVVPNRSKSCTIIIRPCVLTSDPLTSSFVPVSCISSRIISCVAGAVPLWPHGGGSHAPPTEPLSRICVSHTRVDWARTHLHMALHISSPQSSIQISWCCTSPPPTPRVVPLNCKPSGIKTGYKGFWILLALNSINYS